MPKLIIQALDKEWSVDLKEGSNVVGRSTKCTVPVQDQNISREHCEIVMTGGVATLFDKGSMNGTLLNGKRIWEQKLNAGDHIRIVNVVLWFEKKGKSYASPQEKKGSSPPADAKKSKEKGQTDIQTRRVSGTKRSEVRRSSAALVPDYGVWGSAGINWLAILGGVGGLAALIVVAVVGIQFLGGEDGPEIDRDNLLRNNSGFESSEAGPIAGWKLDPPAGSELEVTESAARDGNNALLLTKKRSPAQSIVSATLSAKIKAQAGAYRLSAFAKWGTFTGSAALKITWVRNDGTLFESYSAPVEKSSDWVELSETFSRPSGAQAFRIGLATRGRGGRIYFDDIRLVAVGEGSSPKPVSLRGWSIQASERGAVSVSGGGKVLLNNVHLRLENERQGVSSQLFFPSEVEREGDLLRITGEIPHPVFSDPIPYTLSFKPEAEQLWAMYEFDHADLRQVDRIIISTLFPRGVTLSSVSGSARVFEFAIRDDEFAIRYPGQVPQLHRTENGLRQVFSVTDGEKGKTWVGFAVLSIGKEDPLAAARAKVKDNPGEALEILRAAQRRMVLSREDTSLVGNKVKQLLAMESREWEGVEAGGYLAEALRLRSLVEEASKQLSSYRSRWSGGDFEEKASKWEETLANLEVKGSGSPAQGLFRARQYFEAGSRTLAAEILVALLSHHPDSSVVDEARDLLQTIQSDE